jgi:hypothetical protein
VRLQIETLEDAVRHVRATAGLIPCTHDALIEWAATDTEFNFPAPEQP